MNHLRGSMDPRSRTPGPKEVKMVEILEYEVWRNKRIFLLPVVFSLTFHSWSSQWLLPHFSFNLCPITVGSYLCHSMKPSFPKPCLMFKQNMVHRYVSILTLFYSSSAFVLLTTLLKLLSLLAYLFLLLTLSLVVLQPPILWLCPGRSTDLLPLFSLYDGLINLVYISRPSLFPKRKTLYPQLSTTKL